MGFLTRLWHKLFPASKSQWAKTAEEEFGRNAFRYCATTYAKAGDTVTCENGHIICTFKRNVIVGEEFDSSALGEWTQPQPQLGAIDVPCSTCGARWFKGPYFHFTDGWRIGVGGI
jgi:hypothetical protein